MKICKGQSVFGGIAIGKLCYFQKNEQTVTQNTVTDTDAEKQRFISAKEKAIEELNRLYQASLAELGESNAMIFQIHQMMLEDQDYCDSIEQRIVSKKQNAEYAVEQTAADFAAIFSQMDDSYMRERAADVQDISKRLIHILTGTNNAGMCSDEPSILAAEDLAPSETVQLDKSKILGFATLYGSVNSHTAILARTMGIPAVIGLGNADVKAFNGKLAILDGFTGKLYLDPDPDTLQSLQEKKQETDSEKASLQDLKGFPSQTKDGQVIELCANIGSPQDMEMVLKNDAAGIGLFRSEFLYLENDDYPSEEEQFRAYKQVVEGMEGKRVIIRTLDIGADKQIDYFHLPKEENPAMGYRAIRICLKQKDLFVTQLRALLRASVFGKLAIMFPMITSVDEVRKIKKIVEEVKVSLRAERIPFDENVELGIMIETPAAVVTSDLLAKEVNFFSIGTNDLTQYTLAIDRQNAHLEDFYNPHHPALLRMIRRVADVAHQQGIWMGICGELAADLRLTSFFLALQIEELSVSPSSILPLRKKVRETEISPIRDALLQALDRGELPSA